MCKKNASTNGHRQVLTMSPPGSYAYWVREATHKLRKAPFGTWNDIFDFRNDRFDRDYWGWVDDKKYGRVLQLNEGKLKGKQPAEALDAIFDRLDNWRIDCDHTVQIANLYALRMILGETRFNLRMGSKMLLKPRESTGLTTVLHFAKKNLEAEWRVVVNYDPNKIGFDADEPTIELDGPFDFSPGAPLEETTEELVARAPPGSRVRWTNLPATLSDSFRHENCVKLGPDLYAAGGMENTSFFGIFFTNEFNRELLETHLGLKSNPAPTLDYIRRWIYIDEIEVFDQG